MGRGGWSDSLSDAEMLSTGEISEPRGVAWMNWSWCSVRWLDSTTRLNVVSVSRPTGISLAIVTPSRSLLVLLMTDRSRLP